MYSSSLCFPAISPLFSTSFIIFISYKCAAAAESLYSHDCMTPTSLHHSDFPLWFNSLKTLDELNFPFDLLSSFSPSFWNSEERASKTCLYVQPLLSASMVHSRGVSGQEATHKRGLPDIKCHVLTFVPHGGFQNLIFSSFPSWII